jgi:2-amino-4-hydroxy-6-hydroxymethyldihydropteridine diphosphokinase
MATHQLILCLGGNLGNKSEIFTETLDNVRKHIGIITTMSSVYESPPWGFESKENFWNQVLVVSTTLPPENILFEIRRIEDSFGRRREPGTYLSRRMDIDILFMDNLILDSSNLTIPHPLIEQRRFVLVPLAEILPGLVHPRTGRTASRMLEECQDMTIVEKIPDQEKPV